MNEKLELPMTFSQLSIPKLNPLIRTCEKYCRFNLRNCSLKRDASSYRSFSLAQAAQQVFPDSCHTPFTADMTRSFSKFLAIRDDIVKNKQLTVESRANIYDPLSLLLVNWNLSLFDGACSPETQDYIDEDCMPGWDTWLAIVALDDEEENHALLCWVPPELCRDVDSALAIDAASCMSWLPHDSQKKHPYLLGWGKQWPR